MVGKVGVGGSNVALSQGMDVGELGALEEELQRIRMGAVTGEPVQPAQGRGRMGVGDRAGAQAMRQPQQVRQLEMPASREELALEKELAEKLQALGYLPADGNFTRQEFEAAAQRFATEHRDDLMGVSSIDDLFALLDRIAGAQNSRRNTQQRNWDSSGTTRGVGNAGAGSSRPGVLPSRGSYENAGAGRGALESQPVNPNPPPPGQINQSIADATRRA